MMNRTVWRSLRDLAVKHPSHNTYSLCSAGSEKLTTQQVALLRVAGWLRSAARCKNKQPNRSKGKHAKGH